MSLRARTRALLAGTVAAAVAGLALTLTGGSASAAPAAPPAASGVTKADEIAYLKSLTGNHVLSGQQGGANSNPSQWISKVHDITGKYPGIWNGDFGFSQNDIDNRQTVINEAKAECNAGALPGLMMHACRPDVATCAFEGGSDPVNGSKLSDAEWSQVITDGTTLNNDYKAKLQQFVPYFQQLQDAGIPVLFRPLHEMNEGWAWWGGRPGPNGSARLFQITHDYLEAQGLHNIIWVWALKDVAGGASQAASYYPGDNYVDVVGMDVWVNKFPSNDWYNALSNIAGAKPMALAEVGSVPQPAQLSAQPKWVYWNVWLDYLTNSAYNSNDSVKAGYYDPRVLSRGDIHIPTGGGTTPPPVGGTGVITGVGGKCVDVAGANPANGTAVQLYDCNGTNAQSWTVGSDGTVRALGKCLDVTGQGTANGVKLQLWDCNGSGAQQWVAESDGHLKNPQSGRYLDVPGGNTANGTRLQIWDRNTNAWQIWHLPPGGTTPPPGSCTSSLGSGQYNTPVSFGGKTYQVLVHVPTRAAGARLPLVLDLHGSQSTGAGQLSYSDMAATADTDGFIVAAPTGVVPSGSGYIWNVPYVTPSGTRDDVGFLRQVIDTLTESACVDSARVYATGYSGGGRMTSALGCMLADKFAAIAPVAGIRAGRPDPSDHSRPDLSTCTPSRAVPVIAFHGQQDNTNPYNGGGDATAWQYSVPVAQQAWAGLDGCTTGPTTSQVSTHVSRTVYGGCRDGAEVQLYTVSNGGHTWPDSPQDNGNGTVTHEISADDLMWRFFQQHPMPGSSS
ncbi:glycosyl hydrolase [Streptomyces spinosirectus]|uniref:extracellular catalytic domain type 1 short-chain-length polyhydroxyalkanoate depolymerase n=3 Tax=Streptomyces TaxID=1883 RepID=UPI0030F40A98